MHVLVIAYLLNNAICGQCVCGSGNKRLLFSFKVCGLFLTTYISMYQHIIKSGITCQFLVGLLSVRRSSAYQLTYQTKMRANY